MTIARDPIAEVFERELEGLEAIDRIVDFAFWQLMINHDVTAAKRDVDLCCASLQLRMGAVMADARRALERCRECEREIPTAARNSAGTCADCAQDEAS